MSCCIAATNTAASLEIVEEVIVDAVAVVVVALGAVAVAVVAVGGVVTAGVTVGVVTEVVVVVTAELVAVVAVLPPASLVGGNVAAGGLCGAVGFGGPVGVIFSSVAAGAAVVAFPRPVPLTTVVGVDWAEDAATSKSFNTAKPDLIKSLI